MALLARQETQVPPETEPVSEQATGAAPELASPDDLPLSGTDAPLPGLEELPLTSFGEELVRMLWSLGLILAVLVFLAWLVPRWLGRRRPGSAGGRMRVLETVRLDARTSLHLVRVDGETLLIGAGEGRVTRLMRVGESAGASDQQAGGEADGAVFSDYLASAPAAPFSDVRHGSS